MPDAQVLADGRLDLSRDFSNAADICSVNERVDA